ncbi:MAG: hypothetical protein GXY19_10375 [Phycisphaerae bacterium]|nr:hypothetical protein [Phycisphaerae bacterium]
MTRLEIENPEVDAIVNAARYLGFTNTGKRIQHRLKYAIRLLIRDGDLERNSNLIRRSAT